MTRRSEVIANLRNISLIAHFNVYPRMTWQANARAFRTYFQPCAGVPDTANRRNRRLSVIVDTSWLPWRP